MTAKNTVVGLDIGTCSVKAVWAESHDQKPLVTRTELLRLPTVEADRGALLSSWVEKTGIRRFPCVIGIRGEQCIYQPLLLQPNDPRLPEQAAAMEVIRYNEIADESMAYGFAPLTLEPGKRLLLMTMVRPSVIESLLEEAGRLNLNAVDIVPLPVALFNALDAPNGRPDTVTLYVNIGHTSTEVAIGAPQGLVFARAFPKAGRLFTHVIADADGIPFSQAETVKHDRTSLNDLAEGSPLASAMSSWISELQACLSVYQGILASKKAQPSRIVLAGGSARLKGMREHLERALKLEVFIAESLPGNVASARAPEFAAGAGLAIAGLGLARAPLSLLPESHKNELAVRRNRPCWVASGVLLMLAILVSLFGSHMDLRRQSRFLKAQQDGLSRRQALASDIRVLKAFNANITGMAQPLREGVNNACLMRNLIGLLNRAKAPDDWIVMVCDAESYFSDAERAEKPDPAKPDARSGEKPSPIRPMNRVIVEGYTPTANLSTVQDLIKKLNESPWVSSADLLSDELIAVPQDESGASRRARRFVLELRVVET